jgi:hypothetical protein
MLVGLGREGVSTTIGGTEWLRRGTEMGSSEVECAGEDAEDAGVAQQWTRSQRSTTC